MSLHLMTKVDLKLDWCSHEAAKYAVEKWHYSHRMPKSKLVKIGVWENGQFIGVVIFGVGATADLVKSFKLKPTEGCELVRVALRKHETPVTKIVSIAIRLLKKANEGLRLIVSFADPDQSHVGGIYQAGNWIYAGMSLASDEYIANGKRWHGRALRHEKPAHLTTKQALEALDPNYQVVKGSSKYRYLFPLDDAMRKQIAPLAKPYPKRQHAVEVNKDTAGDQLAEGGAIPTQPLNTKLAE